MDSGEWRQCHCLYMFKSIKLGDNWLVIIRVLVTLLLNLNYSKSTDDETTVNRLVTLLLNTD